jgi:hypothetical protein
MKKPKFKATLTYFKDARIASLAIKTDKKILARWAIDCARRILPYFEEKYPQDRRPREALRVLRKWIATGVFKMAVIRKASLDSHAAAREVREDNPARSAARACGQAVATAHVKTHALGSSIYALQAVYRDAEANNTDAQKAVTKEKDWQYKHLVKLGKNKICP